MVTGIEWLALIVVIIGVVKIATLLIKPMAWFGLAEKIYSNQIITTVLATILAGGSLYLLIDAGITITQIFAVMFFMITFMAIGIAAYGKEILPFAKKLIKSKKLIARSWFYIVVWLAISAWVVYEILM